MPEPLYPPVFQWTTMHTYIMLWTIMDLWFQIPVESSFDSNLFVSTGALELDIRKSPSTGWPICSRGTLREKKTKNAVAIFRSKKSFHERPAAFTGLFRYLLPNHSHSHGPQTKFYFFSIEKLFFRIRPKSFFTHSPIKRFKTNS